MAEHTPNWPAGVAVPAAAGRLAWIVAGSAILGSIAGFGLSLIQAVLSGDASTFLSHVAFNPFITVAFAFLGALVAARRPRNPIGWIFLAVAALFACDVALGGAVQYSLLVRGEAHQRLVALAEWLGNWFWLPGVFLPTVFVLYLFPNGRLLSPRWRPAFWAGAIGLLAITVALALHPGPLAGWGTGPNPFGILAIAPWLERLLTPAGWLLGVGLLGAALSFLLRWRRSRAEEREQMKWLAYAVTVMLAVFLVSSGLAYGWPDSALVTELLLLLTNLTILGLALAAGVGILRHRLYDIDLVINRSLVYAALTGSIALVYGLIVSTTGYFLQTDDNLAGLLLTLAIVAVVFRPLRTNVQQGVNMLVGPAPGPSLAAAPTGGTLAPARAFVEPASVPVPDEARERLAPAPLPFVALVVGLIALGLAFAGLRLATPFANDRIPPAANLSAISAAGVTVTPLDGGPAGLRVGDIVTAVDGQALEAWLRQGSGPGRWQVGETRVYTVMRQGEPRDVPVTLTPYPLLAILRLEWGTMIFYTSFLLLAVYVFLRRPRIPAARALLLGAAAQFSALSWSLGLQVSDLVHGVGLWIYQLTTLGGFMLALIAYFHFALVFPRPAGYVAGRRWLWPLIYGLPYLLLAGYLLVTRLQSDSLLAWISRWGWFTGPHAALFLALTVLTVAGQYRRSRGVTRRQIRWLVLGGLVVAGLTLVLYILPPLTGARGADANLIGLLGLLFPLTVAVSILRHNLFDIDTLLNRALVYGALTAVVVAVYVLVIGLLGTVLQAQGNLFVALVATGLAAVLFQPLRDRLQRTVNRFMYGERDEPFEVLARLGQRLESTLSPESVYPTIIETVSQALKLPYAAVAVWRDGRLETVASYGRPVADLVRYPMTDQGELVGQLLVARRAADEALSPADERILRNIARQAGAVVHAVQLMDDLQRSRQRLVTTREEERRRLRRDLHDGLGPQLASQALTINAIEKLLSRDPERARALLQDLKAQSRDAVQAIRRLVYDLRPPALDELGLVGALRESTARHERQGLQVHIDTPAALPPLPAAVEVAVYRVAQEALTNVVRHARAEICTIRLALERTAKGDALLLAVTDDGQGLPANLQSGVGLQSMRERAAELGGSFDLASRPEGGVRVTVRFPLPAPEAPPEA